MLQRLPGRKIASANRLILEVVIIIKINPLFTARWKYGHAHFWRRVVVFATRNSQQKYAKRRTYGACGGGGLDKATIPMLCYLAASGLLPHDRSFLNTVYGSKGQ